MRPNAFRYLILAMFLLCAPAQAVAQSDLFNPEKLYGFAGRTLAAAITTARDEALKAGTQPIPKEMRRHLAQVFPLEILDRVSYRVSPRGSFAVQALQYGDVIAMTLIDVIVFRSEDDALSNDAVWAHELTHVQQYDRWGVEEFAQRYVRDHKAVEDEAYGFQADYEARKKGAQP